MAIVAEFLIAALILVGAFFLLVGSFALAKLPDMMRRLHGPTKSTTLGIGSILIASMIFAVAVRGSLSLHELLITLFIFLTAPVTAFMISKAHILRNKRERANLPPTGTTNGWATLDAPTPTEEPARAESR